MLRTHLYIQQAADLATEEVSQMQLCSQAAEELITRYRVLWASRLEEHWFWPPLLFFFSFLSFYGHTRSIRRSPG